MSIVACWAGGKGRAVVAAWLLSAGLIGAAWARTEPSTLRAEADRLGLRIGCAAWEMGMQDREPAYTETLSREFNLVATRGQLCTGNVQRKRGSFNFAESDKVFDFARKHGMKVWGHCLLSSQDNVATLPDWIKNGGFSREGLLAIMREHLHTVIGRYRGQAFAWSVVNEPMKQNCFWRKNVGEDWIECALRFAHEADPAATLLINEYKVERGALDGEKGTAFYRQVKSMKERGVPIHAVGFQSYFDVTTNIEDVKRAMNLYADIGVNVHVTELAVRVYSDTPTSHQLRRQAEFYRSFLKACLEAPNCEVLTVFGVTDKLHWLVVRGEKESPVLLDRQYQPKPAYFALLEELKATSSRRK